MSNRDADDYEAKYMSAAALYRDKMRAPPKFMALLALPILILVGCALFVPGMPIAVPFIELPLLALIWILFSVLRITVTRDELVVQYGVFGPRVPIASITKVAAVDYDWKRYGGWGIKRGPGGEIAYNMIGDRGRAVRVEYEAGGRTKKLLLASPDPAALADAIQRARTLASPSRIAAPPVKARVTGDEFPEALAEDDGAEQDREGSARRR